MVTQLMAIVVSGEKSKKFQWCIEMVILVIIASNAGAVQSQSSDEQKIRNFSHQNESDDSFETNHNSNSRDVSDALSGWSEWSDWSPCTRSCDGGISFSFRKCNHKNECTNGSAERHKICNMQPCPTELDFRAVQCSKYNNKHYRGRLYEWLPYSDPKDPCALTCRAKIFNFVAKLAPRVEDGTRCRDGSLDMCVSGKCLSVGCDLQLGSDNKVDGCGVCGGDGSSCTRPTYTWTQTNYAPCSVSCGKGYQMSHPICIDKEAKEQVDEILCDPSVRPRPHINECNTHSCPPFWIIESWSSCSKRCGSGKQYREVYCAQDVVNGTRLRVSDNQCPKQKPITDKSCNTQECPQWFEGPWSQCSATCDTGYQTRAVVCRDVRGLYSNECSNETKPYDRQNCSTGVHCLADQSINWNSQEDSPTADAVPGLRLPWFQRTTKPSISSEPNFIVGEWSSCSVSCGKGIKKRAVDCKIFLQFSKTVARLQDSQCAGPKPSEIEVCVMKDCDVIKDDETEDDNEDEDMEEDDDDSDNDIINSKVEKPINKMIPLSKMGIDSKYFWKSSGFTPCTASCLGGTQESIILCVKDSDHSVVSHYYCDINKKPDSFTRTCNDHPCPPRWNISEYTSCSKPCGSGVQTREAQCVHEVTRGAANTIVVPNSQCEEPMPRIKQFCNVFDCPPQWKAEQWSQCSRSCGGGRKTRKLKCIRELAFGQVVELSSVKCPKKRPKAMKTCNLKQCRNPMIDLRKAVHRLKHNKESNKIDENVFIQKESNKRISLKVSGEAIVISGTIVRLRCPRDGHKHDREDIVTQWYRNKSRVVFSKRVKLTSKNVLRIKSTDTSDSGTYSCSWDNNTFHTIALHIKDLRRTDEDRTVEGPNSGSKIGFNSYDYGKVVIDSEEVNDRSHDISRESLLRRQTLMRAKPKRTNQPPIRGSPLNDESFSAESPTNGDKQMDTFEVNYGSKEVSDQKFANDKSVNNKDEDNSEEKFRGEHKSVDAMSQLEKILSDLKKESKSSSTSLDELSDALGINKSESDFSQTKSHKNYESLMNALVSESGDPDNWKFDWIASQWSACSGGCGATSFQVRTTHCHVMYANVSKTIDNSFCIDAGLRAPETIRQCGQQDCPFWRIGQWSECNQCIDRSVGIQSREVRCALNNGSVLEDSKCQSVPKPIAQKQCVNDLCDGSWVTGDWTQCNAQCGAEGFQSRIIQCVWLNSVVPAGSACDHKPRPDVLRTCVNDTCTASKCEDTSKHCNLAKSLHMCRIEHYKHQCCQSCKAET